MLINALRKAVGQEQVDGLSENSNFNTIQPDWFDETRVQHEFDIRPMLHAGEQPVNQVISDLRQLPENHIYKLIAPFLPAPLIEKAASLSIKHWVKQTGNELFEVYFSK